MDTKAIESQVNGQNTAQGFDQFGSDSIGWNAKLEDVPEDQSHSLYRLLPEVTTTSLSKMSITEERRQETTWSQ